MIFLYHSDASKEFIKLKGDDFKYIIKVRRHKEKDVISIRDIDDTKTLYNYKIDSISNKEVFLSLLSKEENEIKPTKYFHIGWCVIEPKSIEKTLPMLNELGVSKISFIYCDRSQKNFKIDLKRYKRILISSNQQCGRSNFIEFEIYKDLKQFLKDYPNTKVLDFSDNILNDTTDFKTVLVGCEGGFSKEEKELLSSLEVFRFNTPFVLKSQSAVVSIASKVLL
jgi:16S rRNA (uracil1498-N3)-methyltransferase